MTLKKISFPLIVLLLVLPFFLHDLRGKQKKTKKQDESFGFQGQQNFKALNASYKRWLNMVSYISSSEERKVFLKLPTAHDRDMFIRLFWQMRDPTPGTEENEYQKEIEERFAYVNKFYSRGTPRPGWKTDMGRIYMILGKPNNIETFDSANGLYPAQVWYFYGDKKLGLPNYFNVTFFKRFGSGEWVLYDPVSDGPTSLLVNRDDSDTSDSAKVYMTIKKLAPTLAGPAISMIPGHTPYGYRPSPRNSLILSNIYKSPTKKIRPSYASNFLKYKGFVSAEHSTNYIENAHIVAVTRDSTFDYPFVQFSLKPKKISVDFSDKKDQYYFNFNIVVSLTDKDTGTTVYQYSKNFDYYFPPDQLDIIKSGGVLLQDAFPVIPGRYELTVFVQNQVGNGFSFFEKMVTVPGGPSDTSPYLTAPIIGFKTENQASNYFHPFRFAGLKLSVDTDKTFTSKENPHFLAGVYNLNKTTWEKGRIEWELKSTSERNPYLKKGILNLNDHPFHKNMNLLFQVPETSFNAGYYQIKLRLLDPDGNETSSSQDSFAVSPLKTIARPTEMFSRILTDSTYYFDYVLGLQFRNSGDLERGEAFLKKSITVNPNFKQGLMALLETELSLRKFSQVLEKVDLLKDSPKLAFNYHCIKGDALAGLNKPEPALNEYLLANKIYNRDYTLLNRIGKILLKLGNKAQAIKALEASLNIHDKQPLVQKTLDKLKK